MINIKPEHYVNAIKIFIVMSLFFYIRKLNIPDNYKFLLTIVPSLLVLTTTQVFNHFKFKNKNKPLLVRLDDSITDKYLSDEFFYKEDFTIETQPNSHAMIYEVEKPFWIQKGQYLDISNQSNFVKIDNLKLHTNYTLEFWIRLKYLSNNNIVLFNQNHRKILNIHYDDTFVNIGNNKIPYKENEWFHLVIMRGKIDTIGSRTGSMYINGIFNGYLENLPDLSNMNESYLFKYEGDYKDYNKKYHDLSNCSIVRIYDRSLTIDEIQNNYLKDANYFGLENEDVSGRVYVQDKSLVFYLESRISSTPLEMIEKSQIISPKTKTKSIQNQEPVFAIVNEYPKNNPSSKVLFIDPISMTNHKKVDLELKRLHTLRKQNFQKKHTFDFSNISNSSRDWLVMANKSLLKQQKLLKKQPSLKQNDLIIIDNRDKEVIRDNWIPAKKTVMKEEVMKKEIKGEIVKQPKITKVEKVANSKEDKVEMKKLNTTKPIF